MSEYGFLPQVAAEQAAGLTAVLERGSSPELVLARYCDDDFPGLTGEPIGVDFASFLGAEASLVEVPLRLVPPLIEVEDPEESPIWQERALCAQTDPEAFFPEKGGSTREAKRVCISCEVRLECLEYALERDERFGIWGGLSERERRRLKRDAG